MSNHRTFPLILIRYHDANFNTLIEYVSIDQGRTVKGNVLTRDRFGNSTTVRPEITQPVLHGTEQLHGFATIVDGKLVVDAVAS